ncbi:MAG: glycine betaine/L-proline ABC transporter substrate-binding protein ProX [Leptolyngbyaceae cyanobacterium]
MRLRDLSFVAIAAVVAAGMAACQSTPDPTADNGSSSGTATATAMPGEGITVRSGVSPWIEERYQAEIINIGLAELGYEVEEIREAAYPALYTAIASGDLDFTPASFGTLHDAMIEGAGGEEVFEKIGALYPTVFGYQIDKRTADEYQITNLEQLQDPAIAKLFDSDGDGTANFLGCDPGWYCEKVIDHHLTAYGLEETVEVDKGQYTALLPSVLGSYAEGQPILLYAFYPHWIAQELKPDEDVVWIEVPFTSYPEDYESPISEADTTFEGKNLGMAQDSYVVTASDTFIEANPAASRWLEQVQIPIADVNAVSERIYNGENSADDVRRHAEEWVDANREQVDQWLDEARQAAG